MTETTFKVLLYTGVPCHIIKNKQRKYFLWFKVVYVGQLQLNVKTSHQYADSKAYVP